MSSGSVAASLPRTRRSKRLLHIAAGDKGSPSICSAESVPNDAPATEERSDNEIVDEDDLCPICQLLLYRPVVTRCNHAMCESCMAHWADVSVTSQMTIVDVDEEATDFNPVSGVEARCPMCRTATTANLDTRRAERLATRYPLTWGERQSEEEVDSNVCGEEIQTITVYIGNRHILAKDREDANVHEWTFFVRPNRTDIIEEVQILLVSYHRINPSLKRTLLLITSLASHLPTQSRHSSTPSLRDQALRLGLLHHPSLRHPQGRLQLGIKRR